MSHVELGFRRLVAYTVGGVALLAFALILRALFTVQTQGIPTGADSPLQTPANETAAADPFGITFFSEEGDDLEPAWSPDGRYIAYNSTNGNTWSLTIRDLANERVTLIAENAWHPIWSPDGTRLAYIRPNGGVADLYVTDVAGTSHVKVNDVSNPGLAHWLPDGRSLLYSLGGGAGEIHIVSADGLTTRTIVVNGVWRLSLDGLSPDGSHAIGSGTYIDNPNPTGLLSIDLETGTASPLPISDSATIWGLWSPNGEYVAYHIRDPWDTNVNILRVAPARGGEPWTISQLQPGQSAGQHAWSPDSRFVAYLHYASASVLDSGEIVVAWADGSRSIALLPGFGARTFAWSPDGTQIAVSVKNGDQFDIAIIRADEAALLARLLALEATPTPILLPSPTASATSINTPTPPASPNATFPFGTPTPFHNRDFYWPTRLTNDPFGNYRPAVSPDGQRIASASERDGNWDIYLLDRSSSAETRLTDDPNPDMAPSWSPDGARIAYQHNVLNPAGPVLVDRTVMNADGSNKTVVASGSVWSGNQPAAWSPDSRRIAFNDSRHVVVVNVDERREVARFTPPDVQAYLDPAWFDDSQVAFSGDGQLTIGNLSSGAVSAVDGAPRFARLPMTTLTYPRIGYFALEGSSTRLITVWPNGREPHTLAQIGVGLIQQAAWSPDGRFIAYYADDSVYVAIAWGEQYRDNAPLFAIPNATSGLSDLVGLSWLPDSSGFVYVASSDGQPDLFLATLNQEAIQAYVDSYPLYAPVQVTPPAATPPSPTALSPPATPTPDSPPGDDLAATPTPAP